MQARTCIVYLIVSLEQEIDNLIGQTLLTQARLQEKFISDLTDSMQVLGFYSECFSDMQFKKINTSLTIIKLLGMQLICQIVIDGATLTMTRLSIVNRQDSNLAKMTPLRFKYFQMLLGSLKWHMDGNNRNFNYHMKEREMMTCYFVQQLKDNILKFNLCDNL